MSMKCEQIHDMYNTVTLNIFPILETWLALKLIKKKFNSQQHRHERLREEEGRSTKRGHQHANPPPPVRIDQLLSDNHMET